MSGGLIEVRPSRLGRWIVTVACLAVLGISAYAVEQMIAGDWTWNLNGILLGIVSVLLIPCAAVVIAVVATSVVRYDPRTEVIQFQMLGLAQTRGLRKPGTTVKVRVPGVTGGFANKYTVLQPGRIPMTFYGTFNGRVKGLNALLREATDHTPGLAGKADRRLLERR